MKSVKLIVTDIDNTLFNWVHYYVNSLTYMMEQVSEHVGISKTLLMKEAAQVFEENQSIEYPFLVQVLPSIRKNFDDNVDSLLNDLVPKAREWFREEAIKHLTPYTGVLETLDSVRIRRPDVKLVALTDTPRYIAMWKLNKLGLLDKFDAVYGLADPTLPFCDKTGRVLVEMNILQKHFKPSNFEYGGLIRTLPAEYAKPSRGGLKTVLMDFEMDEPIEKRQHVLWIGDNLIKDISLGNDVKVKTAWASYGTNIDQSLYPALEALSPSGKLQYYDRNVEQNQNPDLTLKSFSDLLDHIC